MSCVTATISPACKAITPATEYDATIVGQRVGSDLQFYGVSAGSGINVTQNANDVNISLGPYRLFGMFMNFGLNNLQINNTNVYVNTLDSSDPGQYNQEFYADGIITVPMSTTYFISYLVSYIGANLNVFIETLDGQIVSTSSNTFTANVTDPHSFGAVKYIHLEANTKLRVRISSSSATTVLMRQCYITVSTS